MFSVTEMRIGELHRAKMRFLQALNIDASNRVADDNLRELEAFMRPEEFSIGLAASYPHHHMIRSPRNVPPSELFEILRDPSSAQADYLLQSPFVSRGGGYHH